MTHALNSYASRRRTHFGGAALLLVLPFAIGCPTSKPVAPRQPPPTPVQAAVISDSAVPTSDTYVATIKSRRSATMQPQVDGNLTRIFVKSGDAVKAGQVLMQIDPLKQVAAVQAAARHRAAAEGHLPVQPRLTPPGRKRCSMPASFPSRPTTSPSRACRPRKPALPQLPRQPTHSASSSPTIKSAHPSPASSATSPYISATTFRPPRCSPRSTKQGPRSLHLHPYRARRADTYQGLAVDLVDTTGAVLTHSSVDFVSPQVDNGLQSILAKAAIPSTTNLRNGQLVNARVTLSTHQSAPTVPVLAVTRVGGQSFVYVAAPRGNGFSAHQVAVTLGDPIGNIYPVLAGLQTRRPRHPLRHPVPAGRRSRPANGLIAIRSSAGCRGFCLWLSSPQGT